MLLWFICIIIQMMLKQQWVLIADTTKVLSASFFFPWLPKCPTKHTSWCSPDTSFVPYYTQFGWVVHTLRHSWQVWHNMFHTVYCTPKVCITGPKSCVLASSIFLGQGQTRMKRSRQYFCSTVCSKDQCWAVLRLFLNLSSQGFKLRHALISYFF